MTAHQREWACIYCQDRIIVRSDKSLEESSFDEVVQHRVFIGSILAEKVRNHLFDHQGVKRVPIQTARSEESEEPEGTAGD